MNYIDYDTKDLTFDKVVPMTYRILSVLFNYKRTVEDFQKCGQKAKTGYGFGLVSDCVAGAWQGPCTESDKPIACPDETCQPDYISCLRALVRKEELTAGLSPEQRAARATASKTAALLERVKLGEWEFGSAGAVVP